MAGGIADDVALPLQLRIGLLDGPRWRKVAGSGNQRPADRRRTPCRGLVKTDAVAVRIVDNPGLGAVNRGVAVAAVVKK
jgi:hypothetical protein